MVIFNHTFSADKPIYFPANWESGKTGEELYLEWKASLQHYIISNILQVVAAAVWIAVGCVLVIAGREIRRYDQSHADWPLWIGRIPTGNPIESI